MEMGDGVHHVIIQYYTSTYAFSCFLTVLETEPSYTFDWFIYMSWTDRKVISSPHKTCLCVFMSLLCVAMSVSRPNVTSVFESFCVSPKKCLCRRENVAKTWQIIFVRGWGWGCLRRLCIFVFSWRSENQRDKPQLSNFLTNHIVRSCQPGQCHFV